MCIRDRAEVARKRKFGPGDLVQRVTFHGHRGGGEGEGSGGCLLYTSDAADERSSVDLGGRRIIKKKKKGRLGGARGAIDKGADDAEMRQLEKGSSRKVQKRRE